MSRLIEIPVDANLTLAMAKLNKELEKTGEIIVSTNTVSNPDGTSALVISVKNSPTESKAKSKNLLLDQMPNTFGGKKILID